MRLEFQPTTDSLPAVDNESPNNSSDATTAEFETLLANGIKAAQNGDREKARVNLTRASQIDPASEDAWMWLASISDYPEELLAFLNHALEINPNNARALEWRAATKSLLSKTLVQRAIVAHQQGSDDLADQCLAEAIALDERCEVAWFWKASFSDDKAHRVECLERVIEINADNHEAQAALAGIRRSNYQNDFVKARVAAVTGKRKKAIEILDDILAYAPDQVDVWIFKSHFSIDLSDKISCLESALSIDPNNTGARSAYEFLTATVLSATGVDDPESEMSREEYPITQEVAPFDDEPAAEYEVSSASTNDLSYQVPDILHSDVNVASFDMNGSALANGQTHPEAFPSAPSDGADNFEDEVLVAADPQMDSFAGVEPRSATPMFLVEFPTEYSSEPEDEETVFLDDEPSELFEDEGVTVVTAAGEQAFDYQESFSPEVVADTEPVFEAVNHDPFAEQDGYLSETRPDAVETSGVPCPFCTTDNDPLSFSCSSCRAMLSLSDMESLLANSSADQDVIRQAVTQMEAEWNFRDFSEEELTALGIGHLNLGNYEAGHRYLQEAARLNPNNVILAGQSNAVAIRIEELSRAVATNVMPQGKTILVVDDSPTVRKLISAKLEKSGHHVVCAVDGIEALARIEENVPDLVLLDITMPRMDGYEVCKHIRSNPAAHDLPVVMISGKDGFFDKVRGRMAGTTGYVTKPFGPETLMKALEMYLEPDTAEIN